jgi:NADH-quinone oxidoreductase subunit L
MAWLFYIRDPSLPRRLATQQRPLYLFLLNKWYFDELYDVIFVRPAKWLGNFLWRRGDGDVIDGSLNGVALGIIPFSPASQAARSPATCSTTPSRWCWGSLPLSPG